MRMVRLVFKILVDFCIFCLFFIFIFYCYSRFISQDKLPNVFGYSVLKVVSGSMEPNMSIGDYVIVKSKEKYKVDDIVTYIDSYDSFVTHRIIEIEGNDVITKGDANNTEDEVFDVVNIQGKVIYKLPSIFSKVNTITVLIIIITIFMMKLIIEKLVIKQ